MASPRTIPGLAPIRSDDDLDSLAALCTELVDGHHAWLRREMPRIGTLLFRITEADDDRHPQLPRILEVYGRFTGAMHRHLEIEEEVFFPLVHDLLAGRCSGGGEPGRLEILVDELANEHESVTGVIGELRDLASDYSIPPDSCDAYRMLLTRFAELEGELARHFGLENNILFPRACELERRLIQERRRVRG